MPGLYRFLLRARFPSPLNGMFLNTERSWLAIQGLRRYMRGYRSHFSLWSIMAAPLIAGNDIASMKPEIHDILTNKDVIAIDQDALGKQGKRIRHENDQDVFVKPLDGGGVAVLLLNRGAAEQTISVTWEQLGLAANQSFNGRDLWEHKDLGRLATQFSAPVASHGVAMITLKP